MIRVVDGVDRLLISVLRAACEDVVTYCRVRNLSAKKGSYLARLQSECSREVAAQSMAWLVGVGSDRAVSVRDVCRAIGLRHICLIDCIEETVGREAFLHLQELSQETSA